MYVPMFVTCEQISDIENLRQLLLSNYNTEDIRPPHDQTQAVTINVTFHLVAIQDFDEVRGKFSVIGLLDVIWVDDRLQWTPSSHNDTTSLPLTKTDVWVPDLM